MDIETAPDLAGVAAVNGHDVASSSGTISKAFDYLNRSMSNPGKRAVARVVLSSML
jgi:hypothetical protein